MEELRLQREEQGDPDAALRAAIRAVIEQVAADCGGQRIRRLELEQRADHVAVYATSSSTSATSSRRFL